MIAFDRGPWPAQRSRMIHKLNSSHTIHGARPSLARLRRASPVWNCGGARSAADAEEQRRGFRAPACLVEEVCNPGQAQRVLGGGWRAADGPAVPDFGLRGCGRRLSIDHPAAGDDRHVRRPQLQPVAEEVERVVLRESAWRCWRPGKSAPSATLRLLALSRARWGTLGRADHDVCACGSWIHQPRLRARLSRQPRRFRRGIGRIDHPT